MHEICVGELLITCVGGGGGWTAVLFKIYTPTAQPNLSTTQYRKPQNLAKQKGDMKLYMAMNMYLHKTPCPMSVQAYENKTIDYESVCACVYYEF
jgi:hypothetical protein